jgi:glyoxylase-like metal-dependent hydrolase (beta-lactamase superfamily II)/rhodanese-related sulfurtransferase
MFLKQIYTSCLSEASYFIESEGEAIVIDPIRESAPYLELARERNAKIRYIFETHFHADFISGHVELAQKSGATIVFGPGADTGYQSHTAKDGEEFRIGKIVFRVLHTPGHTPESTCFLLIDENNKNHAIFTGDTLFIGDTGRPDLAVKTDLTMNELAGMLYDSLHNKILPLEDDVMVYPGHGPGSACGKNIGKETFALLGQQRATNYALQRMSREKFIETLTDGILPAPAYFSIAASINKNGYDNLEAVIERTNFALNLGTFKDWMQKGHLVLDTRTSDAFEKGFIPGSVNIGTNGQFAIWAGTLLDYSKPVLLVLEKGKEEEIITRLARVGIENITGYLEGGFETWVMAGEKIDTVDSISPEDLPRYMNEGWKVLDVRKPGEFENGHINGAKTLHLQILEENIGELDKNRPYLVHCAGGYRSMIAASILKQHGFSRFVNVHKGWSAIQNIAGLDIVTGPCEIEKKKMLAAK